MPMSSSSTELATENEASDGRRKGKISDSEERNVASHLNQVFVELGRQEEGLSLLVKAVTDDVQKQVRPSLAAISSRATSFEQQYELLLKIAELLACLNKEWLKGTVGAKVARWSNADCSAVKLIWELGIVVASLMHQQTQHGFQHGNSMVVYDAFLSYAGEDGEPYVRMLKAGLGESFPDAKVFQDCADMLAGTTPNPSFTMFYTILTAKLVVCVASYHYLQKKWPIAELICGLARNRQATKNSPTFTPLFVDAMPGSTWLASTRGERPTTSWLDDVYRLIPLNWTASLNMKTGQMNEHIMSIVHQLSAGCWKEKHVNLSSRQEKDSEDLLLKKALEPLDYSSLIQWNNDKFLEGTRSWAFSEVEEWLRNKPLHKVLVLSGISGVGKTAIMCRLLHLRDDIGAYHYFSWQSNTLNDPKRLIKSICYQLCQKLPEYRQKIVSILQDREQQDPSSNWTLDMFDLFICLLENPLSCMQHRDGSIIILIDALDEVSQAKGAKDLFKCIRLYFRRLPEWIRVCVSTRPHSPMIKQLENSFKPLHVIQPDSDANRKDLRLFFGQLLDRAGCNPFDREEAISTLFDKCGGIFIIAHYLADLLLKVKQGKGSLGISDLKQFPSGMEAVYEDQLDRIFAQLPESATDLVRKILELVVVAKEPLPVDLIPSLLLCDKKECKEVINALSAFFPLLDGRIETYHKSFVDWLTEPSNRLEFLSEYSIDVEAAKGNIATQCQRLLRTMNLQAVVSLNRPKLCDGDLYVLKYTVRHLMESSAWRNRESDIKNLLLNPDLMMARASICDLFCHYQDTASFAERTGSRFMQLVSRAVQLSVHRVKQNCRELPGQLVGRCIGSAKNSQSRVACATSKTIQDLIQTLCTRDYKFDWWCPVGPTWDQANSPCLNVLKGHSGSVYSVCWSPNGEQVASGSRDKSVRIWNAQSGECEAVLEGHSDSVTSVCWSPNGEQVASGSWDESVRIWNAQSGECEAVLKGHSSVVASVCWSPNGEQVASGSWDKSVRIWNAQSGECEAVLEGHSGSVSSVCWSPNGEQVASGSRDESVRIWNAQSGECEAVLEGHGSLTSVCWSPNGEQVASGSLDKSVRIWNAQSGECEAVLVGHSDSVSSVCWSPNGEQVASGSLDESVRIWNAQSGVCEAVLVGHSDSVSSVCWSPNGEQVASGSWDESVRIWNAQSGECEAVLVGHSDSVSSVCWSPNGEQVASGSWDESVRIWNAQSGECEAVLEGHSGSVTSVCWSPNGEQVASGSWDESVRIWNAQSGECEAVLEGHSGSVYSVCWSPNGEQVASGSLDKSVRIWNAQSGECEAVLEGHSSVVASVCWSPNGEQVASGSQDKSVRIWNAQSGECETVLEGHSGSVSSVCWSPNGEQVASGSLDKSVRIWNAQSGGECEAVLVGHSGSVYSVCWSPNGEQVASGSQDESVRIWNAQSGECEAVLEGSSDARSVWGMSDEYMVFLGYTSKENVSFGDAVGVDCKAFSFRGLLAVGLLNERHIVFFRLQLSRLRM